MTFDHWGSVDEIFRDFHAAICRGTHGLIQELLLHLRNEDCLVVQGRAHNYYGVQLAIHTIRQFGEENLWFPNTQLSLTVHDRRLDLLISHPGNALLAASSSPCDVTCRPRLTVVATA
ncbi:MAG: hypothetical protein KDA86_18080 [Planctomycetaceae bacterium]|nr:hypothetical protein [Planctomycetaceae bacterium]MCA9108307.1 hypothetical protein [Planctomycetaceae bacterium]